MTYRSTPSHTVSCKLQAACTSPAPVWDSAADYAGCRSKQSRRNVGHTIKSSRDSRGTGKVAVRFEVGEFAGATLILTAGLFLCHTERSRNQPHYFH